MQWTRSRRFGLALASMAVLAVPDLGAGEWPHGLPGARSSAKESLGRRLFFETSLSTPAGQACSACHDPRVAFADPATGLPVSRGARPGLYGSRNDQPVAYAAFVPPRQRDPEEGMWVGGLFWDGRANTLAEQAQGPPLNPDGFAFVDLGLGAIVKDPAEDGKFRVPTLRNVAVTAPYMHNGVFKTLFQVLAFYNTRDVARWLAPEVGRNVNSEELGNLRLSNQELEDVVAFLQTLTDGWTDAAQATRPRLD